MFETPHRLHAAAIIIDFGQYLRRMIGAVIVPFASIFISGGGSKSQYMGLIIAAGVLGISSLALIGPVLNFFSTTYFIESESLVIASGFVWRKRRTIPLARIQNVNIQRTIWHRLLGAAAVKVETAAGGGVEGQLAALSLADANKLQAVLLLHRQVDDTPETPKEPDALYALTTKQVLLAGALGNRIMYIIAGIFGVVQVDAINSFSFKPLIKMLDKMSPFAGALMAMLSAIILVLIGWLVSIGMSATRFYGFRIERHERGLRLAHGLITQFQSIVPVGRIQVVRIVQPIFFRLFGYCEVYADTAGSFDDKDAATANKICPLLEEEGIEGIGKLLLPDFEFYNLQWRQVSKKSIRRHAFRSLIAWLILAMLPLAFWLKLNVLWLLIPLLPWCWISGILYYRYAGYATNEHHIASRQGIFRKQVVMMPFDRIQHYTINQSLTQRWAKLATVVVMSGSSSGHPIGIMDVDQDVAEALRQKLSESIRRNLGARTGGL